VIRGYFRIEVISHQRGLQRNRSPAYVSSHGKCLLELSPHLVHSTETPPYNLRNQVLALGPPSSDRQEEADFYSACPSSFVTRDKSSAKSLWIVAGLQRFATSPGESAVWPTSTTKFSQQVCKARQLVARASHNSRIQ
jgi:hypothetical protein